MKDLRWICAGALVAVAGTIAFANVAGTSRPTAAVPAAPESAPVASTAPATPVVAEAVVPAPQMAAVKTKPGIVPGSAGMVIAIDPETGEAGLPTREQLTELGLETSQVISHEDDGLTPVRHADGHWSVDLQGRYQEYAVVRKTADGKTVMGCVDHPSKLDQLQPAPAALEEE